MGIQAMDNRPGSHAMVRIWRGIGYPAAQVVSMMSPVIKRRRALLEYPDVTVAKSAGGVPVTQVDGKWPQESAHYGQANESTDDFGVQLAGLAGAWPRTYLIREDSGRLRGRFFRFGGGVMMGEDEDSCLKIDLVSRRRYRPAIRALNVAARAAELCGLPLGKLDQDSILRAAKRSVKLTDWGSETFRTHGADAELCARK